MLVSFAVGDANFSLANFPMRNLKFAFYPTRNPNASHWNIGCVGSQCIILALAMYISCFLCLFHLHLEPNANPVSIGIWALELANFHMKLNGCAEIAECLLFQVLSITTSKTS